MNSKVLTILVAFAALGIVSGCADEERVYKAKSR